MNISEVFIRRPIATALLMAGLFAFGVVCFTLLPVSALPNVEFPTISVSAQLPGREPDRDGLDGGDAARRPVHRYSRALLDDLNERARLDIDHAAVRLEHKHRLRDAGYVQQAIKAASGLLPKNMPTPPTYRETNPANAPVLIYAVHSDAYPIQELDQYANILLAQSLSRVSGVGQVIIAGQAAARRAGANSIPRRSRRRDWASRRSSAALNAESDASADGQSRRPPRRNCRSTSTSSSPTPPSSAR